MSRVLPTQKDGIIDDMDEAFELALTDSEYERLRRLTQADLFLVTLLLSRATRKAREKDESHENPHE